MTKFMTFEEKVGVVLRNPKGETPLESRVAQLQAENEALKKVARWAWYLWRTGANYNTIEYFYDRMGSALAEAIDAGFFIRPSMGDYMACVAEALD